MARPKWALKLFQIEQSLYCIWHNSPSHCLQVFHLIYICQSCSSWWHHSKVKGMQESLLNSDLQLRIKKFLNLHDRCLPFVKHTATFRHPATSRNSYLFSTKHLLVSATHFEISRQVTNPRHRIPGGWTLWNFECYISITGCIQTSPH